MTGSSLTSFQKRYPKGKKAHLEIEKLAVYPMRVVVTFITQFSSLERSLKHCDYPKESNF